MDSPAGFPESVGFPRPNCLIFIERPKGLEWFKSRKKIMWERLISPHPQAGGASLKKRELSCVLARSELVTLT